MPSSGNAQKPQIWPISAKSKWRQKEGKSTDHDHNLISSEGTQDTSTCKFSDYSLHAKSCKCPETSLDGQTCRKTVMVGRMDQQTHVQVKRGYSRLRTDGQMDGGTGGQLQNIIPPTPIGGGITTVLSLTIQNSVKFVLRFSVKHTQKPSLDV